MININIEGNIIAHRGVHNNKEIPENSIAAFELALKYNYPIELDIQLTKDNILIVFHDFDLYRMTGVNKKVAEETYANIKKYKLLNTNQHIPKLSEVLKLVNGKVLLDIEIKNTKRITQISEILFEELKDYNSNYIIKSFNPKIVRYIKNNYPCTKTGLLIGIKYNNIIHKIILKTNLIIKYSKADFLALNKQLIKTNKYKKLSLIYPILLWVITNPNEINNSQYVYICNKLPYNTNKNYLIK